MQKLTTGYRLLSARSDRDEGESPVMYVTLAGTKGSENALKASHTHVEES